MNPPPPASEPPTQATGVVIQNSPEPPPVRVCISMGAHTRTTTGEVRGCASCAACYPFASFLSKTRNVTAEGVFFPSQQMSSQELLLRMHRGRLKRSARAVCAQCNYLGI